MCFFLAMASKSIFLTRLIFVQYNNRMLKLQNVKIAAKGKCAETWKKKQGGGLVRKEERVFLLALFAIAFLLLLPALIEGPQDADLASVGHPLALVLFNTTRAMEHQPGDQGSPNRMDHPESVAVTEIQVLTRPDIKSDANGHPLGENTYIKAVYQAFRLEDKSG
jgi:hypothetical protein